MTSQVPDSGNETASFKLADAKIVSLRKRLAGKQACPCCTARALAYHAAAMCTEHMGSDEAIETFEMLVGWMREKDVPAPEPSPSTETH